jgi:hypothetical protein
VENQLGLVIGGFENRCKLGDPVHGLDFWSTTLPDDIVFPVLTNNICSITLPIIVATYGSQFRLH